MRVALYSAPPSPQAVKRRPLYQKRYFLTTLPGKPHLRRRGEYLICRTTDGAWRGASAHWEP